MPTIDDVAKLAGVSPATVSKVLNNRPYVSSATRQRVALVIAETGFVPSRRARGLSQRRSFILGLLVPYTADQLFTDPHLLEIMRGIESETVAHDYNLLLSTARSPSDAATAGFSLLRNDTIDAAIVVETLDIRPFTETLSGQHAPWVVIGYSQQLGVIAVHADDYGGALQATRYLLTLGHQRIGVISSSPRPFALDERLRGVKEALRSCNLTLDPNLLVVGDFSFESGEHAANQLLQRPHPPTAIFALNDRMAIGAIRAATALGLTVPGDLSVVGFDDIGLAAQINPPLTTVRQPGFALGAAAARMIFSLLDGQAPATPQVIPTQLLIRDTACPPYPYQRRGEVK